MNELALNKGLDFQNNVEEKSQEVEKNTFIKDLQAQGYQEVPLSYVEDADTIVYKDQSGNLVQGRIYGTDSLETAKHGISGYHYGLGNRNKATKGLQQVALMYNTDIDNVTPEMWDNAANFQTQYSLASLTATSKDELPVWDSSKVYEKVDTSLEGRTAWVKQVGTGYYGRPLIEVANPILQVSYNRIHDSPALSANNVAPEMSIHQRESILNSVRDNSPTNSPIQRFIDRVEASSIRMTASLVDEYLPDFVSNYLNTERKKETGFSYSDIRKDMNISLMEAGATPEDRAYFDKRSLEIKDSFDKVYDDFSFENVQELLSLSVSSPDVFVADSAIYMLSSMGTAALARAVAATGVGTVPALAVMVAGSSVTALELVAQDMQEYRDNNDGKDMPMSTALGNFAAYLLSENLEALGLGKVISRFIPSNALNKTKKSLQKVEAANKKGAIRNTAEATVIGAATETPVEMFQTGVSGYTTQNEETGIKSILDYAKANQKDIAHAGFMGAGGGGIVSGSLSGAANSLQKLTNLNSDKTKGSAVVSAITSSLAKSKEKFNDKGQSVDVNTNRDFTEQLSTVDIRYTNEEVSLEQAPKAFTDKMTLFNNALNSSDVSMANKEEIYKKRVQTLVYAIEAGNEEAKAIAKAENLDRMIEEFLHYGSDPEYNTLPDEGKKAYLKKLGLNDAQAEKVSSLDKVELEARYGSGKNGGKVGYFTYMKQIDDLNSLIKDETNPEQLERLNKGKDRATTRLQHYLETQKYKLSKLEEGQQQLANSPNRNTLKVFYSVDDRASFTIGRSEAHQRAVNNLINVVNDNINNMTSYLESIGVSSTTDTSTVDAVTTTTSTSSSTANTTTNTQTIVDPTPTSENTQTTPEALIEPSENVIESVSDNNVVSTSDGSSLLKPFTQPTSSNKSRTIKVKLTKRALTNKKRARLKRYTGNTVGWKNNVLLDLLKGTISTKEAIRVLVQAGNSNKEARTIINKIKNIHGKGFFTTAVNSKNIDEVIKDIINLTPELQGTLTVSTLLSELAKNDSTFLAIGNNITLESEVTTKRKAKVKPKAVPKLQQGNLLEPANTTPDNTTILLDSIENNSTIEVIINNLRKVLFTSNKPSEELRVFERIVNKVRRLNTKVYTVKEQEQYEALLTSEGLNPSNSTLSDIYAIAFTNKNIIIVNGNKLSKNTPEILLHELDHIYSSAAIREASNTKHPNHKYYQQLVDIYKYIQSNLKPVQEQLKGKIKPNSYEALQLNYLFGATENNGFFTTDKKGNKVPTYRAVEEMVALTKAQKVVRDVLQTMYIEDKSLLTRIMDALRSVLGLSKNTLSVYKQIVLLNDHYIVGDPQAKKDTFSANKLQPLFKVLHRIANDSNITFGEEVLDSTKLDTVIKKLRTRYSTKELDQIINDFESNGFILNDGTVIQHDDTGVKMLLNAVKDNTLFDLTPFKELINLTELNSFLINKIEFKSIPHAVEFMKAVGKKKQDILDMSDEDISKLTLDFKKDKHAITNALTSYILQNRRLVELIRTAPIGQLTNDSDLSEILADTKTKVNNVIDKLNGLTLTQYVSKVYGIRSVILSLNRTMKDFANKPTHENFKYLFSNLKKILESPNKTEATSKLIEDINVLVSKRLQLELDVKRITDTFNSKGIDIDRLKELGYERESNLLERLQRAIRKVDKDLLALGNKVPTAASKTLLTPIANSKKAPVETVDGRIHINDVSAIVGVKEFATNLLATFAVSLPKDSTLISKIASALKPYKIVEEGKLEVVDAPISILNKNKVEDNPALQLVLSKNGETTDGEYTVNNNNNTNTNITLKVSINNNVAVAIDYAVKELVAINSSLFRWDASKVSDSSINFTGNLQGSTNTTKAIALNRLGSPYAAVANTIGKSIADKLGLKPLDSGLFGQYERVVAGLGQIAIHYAIQEGILSINADEGNVFRSNNKYPVSLWLKPVTIINEDGSVSTKNRDDFLSYEEQYNIQDTSFNGIRTTKPVARFDRTVMNTDERVTNVVNEVINKLESTPYELSEVEWDIIDSIPKELVLKYMGKRTDFDNMSYATKLSYHGSEDTENPSGLGKNQDLENEYTNLANLAKSGYRGALYFMYKIMAVGRLLVSGSMINYQTNKQLQRWLVAPKQAMNNFDFSNPDHKTMFAYAAAQAFDYHKNSSEDILAWFDNLLDINPDDIVTALQEDTLNSILPDVGIEHIGHVVNVIRALKDYHEAAKEQDNPKNSVKFSTKLLYESDMITQGIATRFAQYPANTPVGKVNPMYESLKRVGIYIHRDEENFNHFDAKLEVNDQGNKLTLDMYEYAASIHEPKEKLTFDDKKKDSTIFNEFFDIIKPLIPTKASDGTITSALRKIYKPIVMVIPYGAGRESVAETMSNSLKETVVNLLVGDAKIDADLQPIVDKVKAEIASYLGISSDELTVALKNKPLTTIFRDNTTKAVNLDQLLSTIFKEAYGYTIYDSIQDILIKEVTIGNVVGKVYQFVGNIYNALIEYGISQLTNPTVEQVKAVYKKYAPFKPKIASLIGDAGFEDGYPISETEVASDDTLTTRVVFPEVVSNRIDAQIKSTDTKGNKVFTRQVAIGTVNPLVRGVADIANKGNLYSIQNLESAIVQTAIHEIDVALSIIHDAAVTGALDAVEVTNTLNRVFFDTQQKVSIFEEAIKQLEPIAQALNSKRQTKLGTLTKEELAAIDVYLKGKNEKGYPRNSVRTSQTESGNEFDLNLLPTGKSTYARVNVQQLLNGLRTLYQTQVKSARTQLFNELNKKSSIIANIPSPLDDGIFRPSITASNEAVIEANTPSVTDDSHGDSPITTDTEQTTTSTSIVNVEDRLELFDNLVKSEPQKDSNEHLQDLSELVADVLPRETAQEIEIVINTITGGDRNRGSFYPKSEDRKKGLIALNWLSDNNATSKGKSKAEIYAHELLHVILHSVLHNPVEYGATHLIRTAEQLQTYVAGLLTWQDLVTDGILPNDFQDTNDYISKLPLATQNFIAEAKQEFDYIFGANSKSLSEFMVWGLTNEKVKNILKSVDNPFKLTKGEGNLTLFNKVVEFFKKVIGVFTGSTSAKDVLSTNTYGKKEQNAFDVLYSLYNDVANINKQHKQKARRLMSPLVLAGNALQTAINLGDIKLKPLLTKLIERNNHLAKLVYTDGTKGHAVTLPKDATLGQVLKHFGTYLYLAATSTHMRNQLKLFPVIMGIPPESTFMDWFNNMYEGDDLNRMVTEYGNATRHIESQANTLQQQTEGQLLQLLKGDNKRPSQELLEATTKVLLRTDLQSLYDSGMSIEDILELMSDKDKLQKNIANLKQSIHKQTSTMNLVGRKIINLSKVLARYMNTGQALEIMETNAINIVRASGFIPKANSKLVKDVDKLVTLLALEQVSDTDKQEIVNAPKEAIAMFLGLAVNHNKEKERQLKGRTRELIKGYTYSINKNDYQFRLDVNNQTTRDIMKEEGYYPVEGTETKSGHILYADKWTKGTNISGGIWSINSDNKMGTAFREFTRKSKATTVVSTSTQGERATELLKRQQSLIAKNDDVNLDTLDKLSLGLTALNSSDNRGKRKVTYVSTLPSNVADKAFNNDLSGPAILGAMLGNNLRSANGDRVNDSILDMFVKYMKDHTLYHDYLANSGFRGAIKIEPNSPNKFIREHYQYLPKHVKEYINNNDLYIRQDIIKEFFGANANPSLADMSVMGVKPLHLMPREIRRIIKITERLWTMVINFAKQTIIIRMPTVLINNVLTNISALRIQGIPLATILSGMLKYASALRYYKNIEKKRNALQLKVDAGLGTKKDIQQINLLQRSMDQNIVKPLVDAGQFQSVFEDLPQDMELTNKLGEFITNKVNVPQPVRTLTKNLFMVEGTPVYDFLFQATQYSDFVARGVLYEFGMKEGKKNGYKLEGKTNSPELFKKKLLDFAMTRFINYDKPLASTEQWVNNMGLIMFTKFIKGIQKVIFTSVKDRPVSAMWLLMMQQVVSTDHILAQHMLAGKLPTLNNPIDIAEVGVTPAVLNMIL